MEWFWLAVAILSLAFALVKIGALGFAEGSTYLIAPVLAGTLYGMRRYVRKRTGMDNE